MIKSRKILDSWYKTFFYGGWTTENGTVRLNKEYEAIDKDLDRLEKLEQAIKIIKAKRVTVSFLLTTLCVKEYNAFVITTKELSQEEYELLIEVFEDVD